MKSNPSVFLALGLMIIAGAVLRVAGYAPQLALAVFGAVVVSDKRLAFVLPLVSMLLSDVLYEMLFRAGYMPYGGFYEGQVTNYLLFAGVTLLGFWARNQHWARIVTVTLAAPVAYFLASNFMVWIGGGGLGRAATFDGLMQCYTDALPFFRSSLEYTVFFAALLFGGYFLLQRATAPREAIA